MPLRYVPGAMSKIANQFSSPFFKLIVLTYCNKVKLEKDSYSPLLPLACCWPPNSSADCLQYPVLPRAVYNVYK